MVKKTVRSSIIKASLLAAWFGSASLIHAAGMGKLKVFSGIGQPLNAEVLLTASPTEISSLSARLASHEAFNEAGVEYQPSLLSGLRFNIEKSEAGQPLLKLTTDRPVNEPFLHFLVEISWASGRMMREYTFLLDPPEMLQVAKPASVVSPVVPAVTAAAPAVVAPSIAEVADGRASVAVKPMPVSPEEPRKTGQRAQQVDRKPTLTSTPAPGQVASTEYGIKRGDTLGKIAREFMPDSVSLEQMLTALYNSNPHAFIGNNINRIRADRMIRIPDASEIAQIDPATARKLVISHASVFDAYRRRLADSASVAPMADASAKQSATGVIKPKVEDKTPPAPVKDKLEVSRSESKKVSGAGLEEDLIAREKALNEASERIVLLEKNIENLKKLVEIKSQAGAQMQQDNLAAAGKPTEPVKSDKPAEAQPSPAPADSTVADPAKPGEQAPAKPAEPVAEPPAVKKPIVVTPPPPMPEPSFIEDNPELVFGGGGLIALLLGYLGYSTWRRKKAAAEQFDEEDFSAPLNEQALGIEPDNAGAASEVSILGNFSESALAATDEVVDPVAEAEVLMAYGRDHQAEEVLVAGLKQDPNRSAIHMKLLELHSKLGDIAQFEAVASKLKTLKNGQGEEWNKAVGMARLLGLTGGIFGSQPAAEIRAPSVPAAPPVVTPPAAPVVAPQVSEPVVQAPEPIVKQAEPIVEPEPARIHDVFAKENRVDTSDLDFDLDLGTVETVIEDLPARTADRGEAENAVAEASPDNAEENNIDFDFDIPNLADEIADPAKDVAQSMDIDLDLGQPEKLVTQAVADVAPPRTAVPPAQASAPAKPQPSDSTEMPDIKFDFDLELEPQQADKSREMDTISAAVSKSSGMMEEQINPEVETKFELAQAYEEMGDLVGARELLNEILAEGTEYQKTQARAKLDQMGG